MQFIKVPISHIMSSRRGASAVPHRRRSGINPHPVNLAQESPLPPDSGARMTRPVRVAVQIQPGGTPDYRTWRDAVLAADDLGVDVIFGYDHFHRPAMEAIVDGKPVLEDE